MHHLDSLLSTFSLHVKISYQIATECSIWIHCFNVVLCMSNAVSNSDIVHHLSPFFQIVLNTVRMHYSRHNTCFRYIVFIYFSAFQIVSNTVRMRALALESFTSTPSILFPIIFKQFIMRRYRISNFSKGECSRTP